MISREQITQKIDYVISCAGQFNDEQFQQVLVGLIKKGGKDAEYILVQYITASDIPYETRANIIYSAGDIKNVMYLLPLKKVIDEEPNIKLKKAAILALAGYNNERALNILQGALDTVTNPILKKTIQEKINLIRQKHPVLALTPRFLKGSKDIKAYQVSLGILKKTLNPDEASSFLKHKDSEDPLVRKGVFEILCHAADASVRESVIKLCLQRADSLDCVDQPKCDDLYILMGNLKHYLERFPSGMDAQCIHIKSLFAAVGDIRVKNMIIGIFCRCQNPDAFVFMKEIYDQQPDFREAIIEESAGNAQAVTFLFKQYQSGQTLKEKVIGSLLHSTQGLNYFLKNFPTFDEQHQEMVVRNLPYSDNPILTEFIESILKSGAPNLKKYILDTVRKNHLHHFKHLLFDPGKEEEFFSMEQEYLDTIFEVFPTASAKKLMIRIAEGELDLGTMKRYMK
ncbi:MAG: HEAT repeat domain-containing protein, partial [bacterium]|nr:HEAT repeat domain-containing protein [bacterium]